MIKVYSVYVYKPKNPLRWIFNDCRIEKIANKHSGLVGFIKHKNGIEVLYDTKDVVLAMPVLFMAYGYKADKGIECYISDNVYEWYIKYRGKCCRWIYGKDCF